MVLPTGSVVLSDIPYDGSLRARAGEVLELARFHRSRGRLAPMLRERAADALAYWRAVRAAPLVTLDRSKVIGEVAGSVAKKKLKSEVKAAFLPSREQRAELRANPADLAVDHRQGRTIALAPDQPLGAGRHQLAVPGHQARLRLEIQRGAI